MSSKWFGVKAEKMARRYLKVSLLDWKAGGKDVLDKSFAWKYSTFSWKYVLLLKIFFHWKLSFQLT